MNESQVHDAVDGVIDYKEFLNAAIHHLHVENDEVRMYCIVPEPPPVFVYGCHMLVVSTQNVKEDCEQWRLGHPIPSMSAAMTLKS
jgi:hypothetical protein